MSTIENQLRMPVSCNPSVQACKHCLRKRKSLNFSGSPGRAGLGPPKQHYGFWDSGARLGWVPQNSYTVSGYLELAWLGPPKQLYSSGSLRLGWAGLGWVPQNSCTVSGSLELAGLGPPKKPYSFWVSRTGWAGSPKTALQLLGLRGWLGWLKLGHILALRSM
ncbi:hypothetical protein PoB_004200800 [Plakobranchus ocellatus]|uniref:Uncharacterized protein n=1 Tax=Plakobranchus ocellatus TaxID=259542 RepID=A0AAV4B7B6_9GAST|nr:hypothetical protein PoB_004200800 [Plakobranchus ocellatus]